MKKRPNCQPPRTKAKVPARALVPAEVAQICAADVGEHAGVLDVSALVLIRRDFGEALRTAHAAKVHHIFERLAVKLALELVDQLAATPAPESAHVTCAPPPRVHHARAIRGAA